MTAQLQLLLELRAATHDRGPTPCQLGSNPERWFPSAPLDPAEAAALCADCPALSDCLDYALAADERFGIWGGTSPAERHRLATT
jgi:hypothetical protein